MQKEKISLFAYTGFGILIGVVSFYLRKMIGDPIFPIAVLFLVIGGLFVFYLVLKKALKSDEKMKWFITNGGWIYIFVWFITLTILLNIQMNGLFV